MKQLLCAWLILAASSVSLAAPDGADTTHPLGAPAQHTRVLGLKGAPNFRDIGGYATTNGRHVRWGEVYRSNELSKLSDADAEKVAALGLESVIDLRTVDERQRAPSVWLHAPPDIYESPKPTLAPVMHTILSDAGTGEGARAGMIKFYRQMPDEYHEEYAAMLHRIASGKLPVLVHCTAGKDRTGVAMAVLLRTLGVPRRTVVDDYALTEQLLPVPAGAQAAAPSPLAQLPPQARQALFRSDPDYISAALDSIDREYGSVEAYVERELGVDESEVRSLRAKLLQ